MNSERYIGLDVYQATIMVAVMDCTGKLVIESILETEAATILQFFAGLRGTLWVTFEEGTWSAWLSDLLNPHVDKLVVCNARKNAQLKDGNKSDRMCNRDITPIATTTLCFRWNCVKRSPCLEGEHNAEAQTWKKQFGSFGSRVRQHGNELWLRSGRRQEGNDFAHSDGSRTRRHVLRPFVASGNCDALRGWHTPGKKLRHPGSTGNGASAPEETHA
jgi:hypothetical protein